MKQLIAAPQSSALLAPTQATFRDPARITLPPLPRREPRRFQTKAHAEAGDAAWYDEYYKRIVARKPAADGRPVPRTLKALGPWNYFVLPALRAVLKPTDKILELGCGQGHVLRCLDRDGIVKQENIHGLDQSRTAVEVVKGFLPKANVTTGDIYQLEHPADTFPACLLMESIEHLEHPKTALEEVLRVTAPGGHLFLSFPNFLHLPWLIVRLLSDLLNKPNWVVRQPVDKIYTVFNVIRLARRAGFRFEKAIGSNYGPPVLYPLEKEWVTRSLNALGLWWLSYHPILVFRKPSTEPVAAAEPARTEACPRRWPAFREAFSLLAGGLVTCLRQVSRLAKWTRQVCCRRGGLRPA